MVSFLIFTVSALNILDTTMYMIVHLVSIILCVCGCVRVCVHVWIRARVCAGVCVLERGGDSHCAISSHVFLCICLHKHDAQFVVWSLNIMNCIVMKMKLCAASRNLSGTFLTFFCILHQNTLCRFFQSCDFVSLCRVYRLYGSTVDTRLCANCTSTELLLSLKLTSF
jgi:hypothetical protein